MITAIRATSRTIADFLQAELEADPDLGPLFSGGGAMRVYLNTPAQMTGNRSGLSVWLYRVTRDDVTLNRPPERVSPTRLAPAPLPVRLHYLIAPIINSNAADSPETEQVILGKALQALNDHPQLRGVDLKDDFQGTRTVVTSRFEGLSIDELARVWDALNASYRTSVSYEVTVIDIETPLRTETAAPVHIPLVEPAVIVGGP
ncbi:hypothetical protein A5724_19320 [Mycobacterium sp. ACS1612]|uniref:DUF4255 domain-containing protein n=1 Tax=Mycobacterium sp. ACS1612 TaxID=1834117 RepID=UPI00080038B3|nr:DUF4255 domain-containing protein [Mycobacterium sp. ACS1612]OBF33702.1 hypothetical protein A5724_19320 [Mycobacterium sp. ACS1612]